MVFDPEILSQYIKPDLFILLPVLYVIGLLLNQTPKIPKWTHAWIQIIVADIVCVLMIGNNVNAFIQAILITGATVFLKDILHGTVYGLSNAKKNGNGSSDEKNGENREYEKKRGES